MQWASLDDGTLLRLAKAEFDVFLTVDQSLEFQQALPSELALVTVVSRSNEIRALRPYIPKILSVLDSIRPGAAVRVGP
jgi:hypothetical protein